MAWTFFLFFLLYFTSLRNHLGFSLFLSCFMWVVCWWEVEGWGRKNGPGRVDILNPSPAMRQVSYSASYLGKFSYCHGEKRTCTQTPWNPHKRNPLLGEAATGNWLRHRNLPTSLSHSMVPAASVTAHTLPNCRGWDFYQPGAYIFSFSSVNQL